MSTAQQVLVTSRSFGSGGVDPVATAAGHLSFERGNVRHDLDSLAPLLSEAAGWIAGTGAIGAEHLAAAPKLRIIARYGVGVDNVDLQAAQQRGVVVTNTPGANADAVADHTLGLMLASLRNTVVGDRAVRNGDWSARPGRELGECTVGVVGYGAIGKAVRRRLDAFGANVIACDPGVEQADIDLVPLDVLLQQCDVVSLHAPGQSRPLLDAERIALMKPDAVLINTARASLVDEAALTAALESGALGAAALDVVDSEHCEASPMLFAPRAILTPHLASQTSGAVDRLTRSTIDACFRVLVDGLDPQHPVI